MSLIALGAITAAATLASAAMSAGSTSHVNRQNRVFQSGQSDLAYKRDMEMWNKANAYNSPTSQMKRYTDAGLNANLIYGKGTPGNSNNTPSYHPAQSQGKIPSFDFSQIGNFLTTYQNLKLGQAQYDNLKKDREMKDAQTSQILSNVNVTNLTADQLALKNKLMDATFASQASQVEQNLIKTKLGIEHEGANIQGQQTKNLLDNEKLTEMLHNYNLVKGKPIPTNTPYQYIFAANALTKLLEHFLPKSDIAKWFGRGNTVNRTNKLLK